MEERKYFLGFSVFSGIGPIRFRKLLDTFGFAKSAWQAPRSGLAKLIGEKTGGEFDDFRNEFSIEDYERKLAKKNVWFVTLADKNYPQLLKEIKRPPFVLFGKGNREILNRVQDDNFFAVVGTRKITEYGREVTELFTSDLVQNEFTIVSGLALGVDAVAHKTTLENNGKTIAVLGCGVDCCSPEENIDLYDQIIEKGGVIVSELPLGHPPSRGSFPARNRIIAGLSLGVLVTEGAEDSGSLITADYAFQFGRPVFAVPGPITSDLSKGPFKLIQKGAKLVTIPQDIIKNFQFSISNFQSTPIKSESNSKSQSASWRTKTKTGTKEEQEILELLENEGMHFDALVQKTGFSSSKLGSLLTLMEMKGMIKNAEGIFSVSS